MNSCVENSARQASWYLNEVAAGRMNPVKSLPLFRYDISPKKNYYRDCRVNTICLNVTEKKIIEFDSMVETCKWFNLTPGTIQRPFFQSRDGILWIVLRGDIDEEKRSWFDNPDTLFDSAIDSLLEKYRLQVYGLLESGENRTKYGPNPKIPTIAVNLTQKKILRFSSVNDTNDHFHIGVTAKPFFKSPDGDYWVIIRSDKKRFDDNDTTEEIISYAMDTLTLDQKKLLQ